MSASLAPECNETKERYDSCFLKWYSEKFLRGHSSTDECEPLFTQYKQCLTKALKAKGIDTMLDEARVNGEEKDAEHMKRKSSKVRVQAIPFSPHIVGHHQYTMSENIL
ncbi:MAG: Mitochondrial distribution and morphology protein 35 [Geoglossum simile]|nr:MAG: Mitochondrial distribution and morphology protein 35 [Geoglossum simile]